jgi:hypothetical protein
MNDEFEPINSHIPDFSNTLINRITTRNNSDDTVSKQWVDPYRLMLQRKQGETAPIDPSVVQKWPEEDVKALEDFCRRNGIVGMSSRQNPKLALMQLKLQIGDYSGVPLEERCPIGYEKVGTRPNYNPNYPYSEALTKKHIIHG